MRKDLSDPSPRAIADERCVSIIVPVLNEAAATSAMLTHFAQWRAQGAEVIVVDGGSSDATRALAEPAVDRLVQTERGRARQMQAGAQLARGETLLFLHVDTLLPPQALQQVREGLDASGRCWGRFDVRIAGRAPTLKLVAWMMNRRSRWTGIATGDQAVFVRRAAFLQVGGFPDQPLMEDVELSRRLKRLSPPLCLCDKVTTSGRRWESRGVWRTIFLMWSLRLRYWLGTPATELAKAYR